MWVNGTAALSACLHAFSRNEKKKMLPWFRGVAALFLTLSPWGAKMDGARPGRSPRNLRLSVQPRGVLRRFELAPLAR